MKVKDLVICVNGERFTARQISRIVIDGNRFEMECSETDKSSGITKFSRITCRTREVELLCSQMASEESIDILGNRIKTVYCMCAGECRHDT